MSRPKKFDACTGAPAVSKRDLILEAAKEVFLESGYAAASMDAVATKANVSKATIYAHFDSKRGLFEAMIGCRCEDFFADIGLPESFADSRQGLRALGHRFIELILAPEALAIHRVVIAEAPRLPEVGDAFYSAGPVRGLARVAAFLTELTRLGFLTVPEADAPLLADLYLSMLKGDIHSRALLGQPTDQIDVDHLVDMAVELVMARYGVLSS